MTRSTLAVMRVGEHDLPLPAYATEGSAAFDLMANIPETESPTGTYYLQPGATAKIGCGFAFEIPEGYEGSVRGRSGIAFRDSIFTPNEPGTADSDYRGEVCAVLFNAGDSPFRIDHGDRIAQFIIHPAPQFTLVEVPELSATVRGDKGFGSSGVK